jgi:NitT/TauT family transport system substrate-binding protein
MRSLVMTMIGACALLACGSEPQDAAPATDGAPAVRKLRLALNWKPEPEFGGLYEAERAGFFAKRNLAVEITGGPGAPVVQMVQAGKVELGIAAADEVVIARDRGSDVVAVFATYQTSPQGIMAHASRGAASLGALLESGGTLAVEPGLPYVKWFEKHFDLSKTKIVPYGYSVAPFLNDPLLATQVFVTAEPIAARRQGADPKVFLIAESGFDPYAAVVIAKGAWLRENRAVVADFVAALRAGWRAYLDDPAPANALMGGLNQEMDAETFRLGAAAQAPLIENEFTKQHGIGAMSLERWTQLAAQLGTLGLLDGTPKPAECFAEIDPVERP